MEKEEILEMINSLNLQEQIEFESIPNLDLYMDQVITLFEDKLSHTKRNATDKLLTKTMINNYIKDKLLMPAVKKKYTKEHVVLMILLYELKQILTIGDIKDLFGTIINEGKVDGNLLADIYQIYLNSKQMSTTAFEEEVSVINDYVKQEMSALDGILEEIDEQKLSSMIEVILLTQKAEYYKRLAEKIIDEKIKQIEK